MIISEQFLEHAPDSLVTAKPFVIDALTGLAGQEEWSTLETLVEVLTDFTDTEYYRDLLQDVLNHLVEEGTIGRQEFNGQTQYRLL